MANIKYVFAILCDCLSARSKTTLFLVPTQIDRDSFLPSFFLCVSMVKFRISLRHSFKCCPQNPATHVRPRRQQHQHDNNNNNIIGRSASSSSSVKHTTQHTHSKKNNNLMLPNTFTPLQITFAIRSVCGSVWPPSLHTHEKKKKK